MEFHPTEKHLLANFIFVVERHYSIGELNFGSQEQEIDLIKLNVTMNVTQFNNFIHVMKNFGTTQGVEEHKQTLQNLKDQQIENNTNK